MPSKLRKLLCLAPLVPVATTSIILGEAGAAQATVTCNSPTDPHQWDGDGSYNAASTEGTEATIVTQTSAVCDTDHTEGNFSSAWTMIANKDGIHGYAQAGFFRYYGTSDFYYAEYNRTGCAADSCWTRVLTGTPANGSSHTYKVAWNTSSTDEDMYADNTRLLSTNFNPFSYWTDPFADEWYGEVRYNVSDMPGSSTYRTDFSGLEAQRYSDNTFAAIVPNSQENDNPTRFGLNPVSLTEFQIWTK